MLVFMSIQSHIPKNREVLVQIITRVWPGLSTYGNLAEIMVIDGLKLGESCGQCFKIPVVCLEENELFDD